MEGFFRFIASMAGRFIRVIAGLLLIAAGIWWIAGVGRWIAIAVGLVPLSAGLFDWCFFAPLFGMPFIGERLRQRLQRQPGPDQSASPAQPPSEHKDNESAGPEA
jgi:hypothetical protein